VHIIAVILALFFTGSALADDWKEYDNAEYSFAIHFPLDPTLEATTYQGPDGRSLAAHTFSAAKETGVFKLTIVEMPGEETGEDAAVVKDAAKTLAEGSAVRFDIPHRVRAVYGRQLGIAGANGGYTYVALFYYKMRLYLVEGKAFVAGGQAEADAMRFQQSLDFT
jgi:hypothetical protein